MSDRRPVVVVLDEQVDVVLDLSRWQRLAIDALVASGVECGELNLLFVDEETMTGLNREHMGEDRPTDVLSFPLDGADPSVTFGEPFIGDIVVCPPYAARQAAGHAGERGHDGSTGDELALLIVHGVLHVVGHDHVDQADTVAMQTREQQLLAAHHHR